MAQTQLSDGRAPTSPGRRGSLRALCWWRLREGRLLVRDLAVLWLLLAHLDLRTGRA